MFVSVHIQTTVTVAFCMGTGLSIMRQVSRDWRKWQWPMLKLVRESRWTFKITCPACVGCQPCLLCLLQNVYTVEIPCRLYFPRNYVVAPIKRFNFNKSQALINRGHLPQWTTVDHIRLRPDRAIYNSHVYMDLLIEVTCRSGPHTTKTWSSYIQFSCVYRFIITVSTCPLMFVFYRMSSDCSVWHDGQQSSCH